jgi:hypothetical protein
MNNIDLDSAQLPATGSSQRVVPESHRYRWEQQWLQQNRDASAVIDNSYDGAATQNQTTDSHSDNTVARFYSAPNASADQPLTVAYSDGATAHAMGDRNGALAPFATTTAASSIFGIATTTPRDVLQLAEATTSTNTAAPATHYKSAVKQFALWRSDDEIKIAMRLQQSETETAETLGALRQWLKDLRLKLTTVIINGNVRWQAKPRNTDGY